MKRFALTLAAFALTGALAFADDMAAAKPTINVEVNDGLIFTNNSAGNAIKDYGIDYGSGNAGGTVMATFALAGSNFGYSVAPTIKGTGTFLVDHAWAYASPVDGFTTYAGFSGNNAPFGDLDNEGDGHYSTSSVGAWYTTGGLSVGAQLGEIAATTTYWNPIWVAARYTMDKTFSVNVYGSNKQTNTLDAIHVTGSLLAVDNLTLTAGFNGYGMSTTAGTTSKTDVQVGYKITDALGAGVIFYNYNEIGNGTNYSAYNVYASYTLSPQLAISGYYAGTTASGNDVQPEGKLSWTPVAGTTINFAAWYDTTVENNGNLCGTYSGANNVYNSLTNVGGFTGGAFSASVDAKFAF